MSSMPRLPLALQPWLDPAIAVALGIVGQVVLWTGATDEGSLAVTSPSYLVISAAFVLRRRRPLLMAGVIAVCWVTQSLLATSPTSLWALVTILVATFSVGAHADDRAGWMGGALLVAATYAGAWLEPGAQLGDRLFTAPVLCGGPWLAGRLVRRHRTQATTLDALNVELERRRADDVRAATAEERARIARELHDVVAHSISVMVVQAGAAAQVLDAEPTRAREPLEQIRATGKAALGEMRHLLGVLRTDDDGLALSPQPGVHDLPALVEQMRATGLQAELQMPADLPQLSPGCDLAAYRIVQEALTNTLKHAGPVAATVRVACVGGALDVEVRDNGSAPPASSSGGHGLIGMRERARLYGGDVQSGRCPDGGWSVVARLPIDGMDGR
jgi:signal transduction histidine kinase